MKLFTGIFLENKIRGNQHFREGRTSIDYWMCLLTSAQVLLQGGKWFQGGKTASFVHLEKSLLYELFTSFCQALHSVILHMLIVNSDMHMDVVSDPVNVSQVVHLILDTPAAPIPCVFKAWKYHCFLECTKKHLHKLLELIVWISSTYNMARNIGVELNLVFGELTVSLYILF